MSKFNERGHEVPDPTPVEVPVGFNRPLTLQEEIMRFVRREMSQMAEQEGFETFEESDDFDVDDEGLPYSPHELTPMQEERIFRRDASNLDANSESENGRSNGKGGSVESGKGDVEDRDRASKPDSKASSGETAAA